MTRDDDTPTRHGLLDPVERADRDLARLERDRHRRMNPRLRHIALSNLYGSDAAYKAEGYVMAQGGRRRPAKT